VTFPMGGLTSVVIGCGYVGQRLIRVLPSDAPHLAVSRSSVGSNGLVLDLDTDDLAPLMARCGGAVLYAFFPPPSSDERDHRSRLLVEALASELLQPAAVVLISTTGVYGDCGGAWVDEGSPVRPVVVRSQRRLDAEAVWRRYGEMSGVPVAVLRVAGIYGPGKLPSARLQKAQPLLCLEQSPWSNRVHVDDLVRTARSAVGLNTVVNVADGSPSSMTAYFHALADALGVPRLQEASREELASQWSEGLRSYMTESRRVDNTRMRELLGGVLQYPDLQIGLAAAIAESG